MRALRLLEAGQPLQLTELPIPQPGPDEILVQLHNAALNHRDAWITEGKYPGIRYPVTLGSDGAGVTDTGQKVLLQPGLQWGGNERFQSSDYHILGMPRDGTFAEFVCVPAGNVHAAPPHLTSEQAAALPLAGLTAWRALMTQGQAQAHHQILINGIGGGVALLAAQLALALGCTVWATSGHAHKLERAAALGVTGGANYREEGYEKELRRQAGGFNVIIDSAGGHNFGELVKLLLPGGRIVLYGGGQGKASFSPQALFWKQGTIQGSTMGSPAEFVELLNFVEAHQLVPVVDQVFALSEGAAAVERMKRGEQFGKIVLDCTH